MYIFYVEPMPLVAYRQLAIGRGKRNVIPASKNSKSGTPSTWTTKCRTTQPSELARVFGPWRAFALALNNYWRVAWPSLTANANYPLGLACLESHRLACKRSVRPRINGQLCSLYSRPRFGFIPRCANQASHPFAQIVDWFRTMPLAIGRALIQHTTT
jgi:hypothetical protein